MEHLLQTNSLQPTQPLYLYHDWVYGRSKLKTAFLEHENSSIVDTSSCMQTTKRWGYNIINSHRVFYTTHYLHLKVYKFLFCLQPRIFITLSLFIFWYIVFVLSQQIRPSCTFRWRSRLNLTPTLN